MRELTLGQGSIRHAMAQSLDSEAVFRRRAVEAGLPEAALDHLVASGLSTYAKLAYAVTTPGTAPTEDGLRSLLDRAHPDRVAVGTLSSLRRLMFEGQTMVVAQIRKTVEGGEAAKTTELAPAEREHRIHQSYEYVHKMAVQDTIIYLEPYRFTTRMAEVQRDRPPKELVIDQQQLTIRDTECKDRCTITDLFTLSQAFTRRALACDLMGICAFKDMEGWHRFLLEQCQQPAPPHFEAPSMMQVLHTDRAAWVRFAETLTTLKASPDGSLPLDRALRDIRNDHTITFYLLPMPTGHHPKTSVERSDEPGAPKKKRKRAADRKDTPRAPHAPQPASKGSGKGKGKTPSRMPPEFQNKQLHHNLPGGGRICWNFNLKKGCQFAKTNETCARGAHQCLKCLGAHALHECPQPE